MGLFRREPHHVRLAREGGLDLGDPDQGPPPWDASGIHGLQRVREWDVVTTVQAADQAAERVEFVAVGPNETSADGDVAPFAGALAGRLPLPYRAEAVYRGGEQWAVAARRIQIVRLPGVAGEEIELTSHDDERTLVVDGARQMGTIPALERAGHAVRARRVLGDAWEVEIAPL